jgi:glutathione S-transferase
MAFHISYKKGPHMATTVYGAKAFIDILKGVIRDVRVTWLLEELGAPYERVVLDPEKEENKTPEYLALNPTGKVPTLVDESITLFESAAICEYLAEKHQKFIPKHGTPEYWKSRQWSYWLVSNLEPQTGRIFACDFFYDQNETTSEIRGLALNVLPRFLSVLESRLATHKFMLGEEFSVADILLTTNLQSIQHTPILGDYPSVKKYYENCTARPAFQKARSQNGLAE